MHAEGVFHVFFYSMELHGFAWSTFLVIIMTWTLFRYHLFLILNKEKFRVVTEAGNHCSDQYNWYWHVNVLQTLLRLLCLCLSNQNVCHHKSLFGGRTECAAILNKLKQRIKGKIYHNTACTVWLTADLNTKTEWQWASAMKDAN